MAGKRVADGAANATMDAVTSTARRLYRIVENDPPTAWDFTSAKRRGRVLRRSSPELLRIWDGLSAFETIDQALAQARAYPRLGRYIAALDLPAVPEVRVERTTQTDGHYTIWGPIPALIAAVVSVTPVAEIH